MTSPQPSTTRARAWIVAVRQSPVLQPTETPDRVRSLYDLADTFLADRVDEWREAAAR